MPTITNEAPTLITYKAVDASRKRLNLIPTKPVELTAKQLDVLWKKDPVFRVHYADHVVHVDGWEPSDGTKPARVMPRKYQTAHKPAPNFDLNDASEKPEDESVPDGPVDPIEPTPLAGVPGVAKIALGLVAKSESAEQLFAWAKSETRKTVLEAIDKRLDELGVDGEEDVADDGDG